MTMPSAPQPQVETGSPTGGPVSPRPGRARAVPHDLSDQGSAAAWSIISYILSGILFWGGLGWLLDRWLFGSSGESSLIVACGVLVGTVAGGYLGYMRFLQLTRPSSTGPSGRPDDQPIQ